MNRMLTAIAALLGLSVAPALAQNYPTKSVTMIVPFAAGGPTDIIARIVNEHMSRVIGQQIIVENVAGAGGTTGITRAAGATPDGYTIMMGHMGTHGAAPALYPNLKYNPATDFAPVGLAAGTPILIVARKTLPPKDLKEFITWAKAQGEKANHAYAGVASVSHVTGVLLNSVLGTKPTMIPYTGTGPALNDMISGQVDYMTDQIVNVVAQIQGGNIKAYAIALPERSPALPDVPTTKELGLDYQVSAWNAIFAPKGTPPEVVTKLADALDKALDDQKTKDRLLELGGVVPDKAGRTPAALQKLVEAELARWTPVLKAAAATDKK